MLLPLSQKCGFDALVFVIDDGDINIFGLSTVRLYPVKFCDVFIGKQLCSMIICFFTFVMVECSHGLEVKLRHLISKKSLASES